MGFSHSSTTHTVPTTGTDREAQLGRQFLIRAGPNLGLPAGERFLVSLGGGLSYGWYTEVLKDPVRDKHIVWSSQSRKGSGGYQAFMVERMGAVDGHLVGLGFSATVYRLNTDGDSLHGLFDGGTQDRWAALCFTLAWHS